MIGGYYFKEDIDISASLLFGNDFANYADLLSMGNYTGLEPTLRFLIPTIAPGAFGAAGQGRFENYDYGNNSYSLFGQVDFSITDDLTLTFGGNYTNDRKRVATNNFSTDVFSSIDLVQAGVLAGVPAFLATNPAFNPFLGLQPLQFLPGFLNFPNAVEDGRTRDSDFSYTARLSYNFSDNISAYATYATGFKASSFNLSTDSRPFPADFVPGSPFQVPAPAASPIRTAIPNLPANLTSGTRFAGPEDAEVYEIGLKGSFDGFAFNLAIFDQTLRGFQSNVFTGTGFVLGNAEEQSVRGFELDSSISPIPNLTFTAALTYLDASFDSFATGSALTPTFSVVPTDLTGVRPAGTPEFSISVGGTYTHEMGDNEMIFHMDYLMESNVQIAQGAPGFRRAVEALNASISFAMGNGLSITLWGRNLTKATYTTTIFPSVAQAGSLSGYRNQPRTYGGAIKFKF